MRSRSPGGAGRAWRLALRSPAIPGEDLYRALLKVWLGAHPTSASLKKALLGQAQ
jgi:hypothetical protein